MNEELKNKDSKQKEITEGFDYSKLTEETETMLEYLEKISEEVIKMEVECAIANIELASTVDAIELESKIKDVKQMTEMFVNPNEEKAMEETIECANANIELTSTLDAIELDLKIKDVKPMTEMFVNQNEEKAMEEISE